jgi:uncharacterized membrane protein YgaE (UPF0421/DUF939 family)
MWISDIWDRYGGHFKQAVKTGVAALLCLYITKYLGLTQGYWAAVSSIIVLQSHMGATIKASLGRFVATAIGAVIGAIFVAFAGNNYVTVAVAITLSILCCASPRLRDGYRLAGSTVVSVMFSTKFQSPWANSLERFVEVSLGIIVALIISRILWPSRARLHLRNEIQNTFADIYELFKGVIERLRNSAAPAIDELSSKVRQAGRRIHELRQQAIFEPDDVQFSNESIAAVIVHLRLVRQAVDALELATRESKHETFQRTEEPELERLLSEVTNVFEQVATRLWLLDNTFDSHALTEARESFDKRLANITLADCTNNNPIADVLRFHSFLLSLRTLASELSLTTQEIADAR